MTRSNDCFGSLLAVGFMLAWENTELLTTARLPCRAELRRTDCRQLELRAAGDDSVLYTADNLRLHLDAEPSDTSCRRR